MAPIGIALGPVLKGHRQIIAVGSSIWGAEDPEASLGSARALRDWLEDDRERRAWLVIPENDQGSPTGTDKQIAEMLRPAEDSGHLVIVWLSDNELEGAPRLTLFGGLTNEELFASEPKQGLVAGLGYNFPTTRSKRFAVVVDCQTCSNGLEGSKVGHVCKAS